ncbi:hypothetical protein ACFLS9_09770 [Bacteroidota bacterium]
MLVELSIIVLVLVLIIAFEYRIRKPDQILLYESKSKVKRRKSKIYPRHFSLAIPSKSYSKTLDVESEAKGKIAVNVKLVFTVAASLNNITQLIRVGGWDENAVENASKELDIMLQGFVTESTEKKEVEDLNSELILNYLNEKISKTEEVFGLEVLTLTVQSVEPSDKKIADAIRKKEAARIMENAEKVNQDARMTSAQTKYKTDEEIMKYEHDLELKRYELKEVELKKESKLAYQKLEEELKHKKMRLDIDKDEIELIKNTPELLLLTPQIARLAEASQNLKNARTVVSLSPGEADQGNNLVNILQSLLNKLLTGAKKADPDKKSSSS